MRTLFPLDEASPPFLGIFSQDALGYAAVSQGAHRARGITAAVVREIARTHHKQFSTSPVLRCVELTTLSSGLLPVMVPPVLCVVWYGTIL